MCIQLSEEVCIPSFGMQKFQTFNEHVHHEVQHLPAVPVCSVPKRLLRYPVYIADLVISKVHHEFLTGFIGVGKYGCNILSGGEILFQMIIEL